MKSLSYVRLLATPWTAANQAPPSTGFSRQEYWSGVPLPSPMRRAMLSKSLIQFSVGGQGCVPSLLFDLRPNYGWGNENNGLKVAQKVKNSPAVWETWVQSLGWEDPLEKGMATHSSILAWEIHGQMSLLGYSPWGHKELDTTWWLNNNNNPWAALW